MTDNKSRNEIIDSDDTSSDYTPNIRPSRRKITMSTRRNSRMLYLEKYGLDQPGWYSSDNLHDFDNDSTDEDNNEELEEQRKKIEEYRAQPIQPCIDPFAPNTQPIGDTPLKRPVSIRNYMQNTTNQKRPARFVKPINSASSLGKVALPPTEFIHVHKLLEAYEKKVYIEGYLQKKNDLKSNGTSCNANKWTVWYVELCGPVLSLWEASDTSPSQDIFPQYINITDSTVHIEPTISPNAFSLNSAGANRYILQAPDSEALRRWVLAIRLSCFECSRIQEIYTRAFICRPQYTKFLTINKKSHVTATGFLHVRFPNATGWKQYWVVVTNQKRQKGLFSKKATPSTGRIMFYESKKAKYPVMTLQQVVQAYTVYPESPKLISMATLFKIEGSLYQTYSGKDLKLVNASSSALLMTSTTAELVEWLIHVFDCFQLYGRPQSFLNDPFNPKALDFGEMTTSRLNTNLFLEPEEVSHVSIESHLLGAKTEFAAVLAQKLKNRPTPLTIVTETFAASAANHDRHPKPVIARKSQPRALVNASDISDEDGKSDSETDSDDSSIYKLGANAVKQNMKPSTELPPSTSNTTSKSSSEISEVSSSNTIAGAIAADVLLPAVNKLSMVDDFANSVLSNPQFNSQSPMNHHHQQQQQQQEEQKQPVRPKSYAPKTEEKSYQRSFKGTSDSDSSVATEDIQKKKMLAERKQRKHSNASSRLSAIPSRAPFVSPLWQMNHSTASFSQSNNLETSSVDPRMMLNTSSPFFHSTDVLPQHHPQQYQRPERIRYASSVSGYSQKESLSRVNDDDTPIADTYSTGSSVVNQTNSRTKARSEQGFMDQSSFSMMNNGLSPTGLIHTIDERKKQESMTDDQKMMWNRMMQQQQWMMQQVMLQK